MNDLETFSGLSACAVSMTAVRFFSGGDLQQIVSGHTHDVQNDNVEWTGHQHLFGLFKTAGSHDVTIGE